MAKTPYSGLNGQTDSQSGENAAQPTVIEASGQDVIDLPGADFVASADILRDGQDLLLEAPDGTVIVIEGYFSASPTPMLVSPEGAVLTPDLVESFVHHAGPVQYAQANTLSDVSPVGMVEEISGNVTVTRGDGSVEQLAIGTAIYQGDIIETDEDGAVNIVFIDETSFAVSDNARLAIDEYIFDPASESGTSSFSILRGIFVFTSGLIGRNDPDDVTLDTPVGSIGIRGTTIAGEINPEGESQITVIEGAIVISNATGSVTLSGQFETVSLTGYNSDIQSLGTLDSEEINNNYGSLRAVSPQFFSALDDAGLDAQEDTSEADADATNEETIPGDELPVDSTGEEVIAGEQEPVTDDPALLDPALEDPTLDPALEDPTLDPALEDPTLDPALDSTEGPALTSDPTLDPVLDPALTTDTSFDGTTDTFDTTTSDTSLIDTSTTTDTTTTTTTDTTTTTTTTTDTTTTTTPPPPPPLELAFDGGFADINAVAGDPVAVVFTTVNFPDVMFTLNSPVDGSGNPLFFLEQVAPDRAVIKLTVAGAIEADIHGEFFNISVEAQLPDGRSTFIGFEITAIDPVFVSGALDLNTISGAEGFVINGSGGEELGFSVAAAGGDLNGDGLDDFYITNNMASGGEVYSYTGGVKNAERILVGASNEAVVSGAGDFNGDGNLDFIVGTPSKGTDGDAIIDLGGSAITVTNLPTVGFVGTSVAGIGDINGDGLSDVIIGANGAAAGNGAAYILFGGGASNVDLGAMGTNGFSVTGAGVELLGTNVSGAGDFNNDGFSDFMVSRPGSGSVDLYFGADGIAAAGSKITFTGITVDADNEIPILYMGDMNGDGISDIGIASTGANDQFSIYFGSAAPNTTANFTISAAAGHEILGGGFAGDFNGDGFDDGVMAVWDGNLSGVVDIYIIYGDAAMSGSITTADFTLGTAFKMTYTVDYALLSGGNFDFEFSTAGDLDGDGFDDLLIGTPDENGGNGAVTVVYGHPGGGDIISGTMHAVGITTGLPDVIANGANQALVGDSGNNVLNDNGFASTNMRGGAGDDLFILNGVIPGNIDGGAGIDKIDFFGSSVTLDFSIVGSEGLSGIEKIAMMDTGQTLILGIDDIFRLMQESQEIELIGSNVKTLKIADFSGGTTTFNIEDNGTTLPFTLGSPNTTFNDGSASFDVYFYGGGYALLIDQNIDTVAVI